MIYQTLIKPPTDKPTQLINVRTSQMYAAAAKTPEIRNFSDFSFIASLLTF